MAPLDEGLGGALEVGDLATAAAASRGQRAFRSELGRHHACSAAAEIEAAGYSASTDTPAGVLLLLLLLGLLLLRRLHPARHWPALTVHQVLHPLNTSVM
jgi:MYXO-CTERM domain-containing protein